LAEILTIGDRDVFLVVDLQNDFCPGGNLAVPRGAPPSLIHRAMDFLLGSCERFLGSSVLGQRKTLVSSIRVGTPDEAKLTNISPLPRE
jgi:hypothetical protein